MKTYKFIKNGNAWYIDLPDYIDQGGNMGDLQMVDGADKMLDMMSNSYDSVILSVSKERFDKSDCIILFEKCDPLIGGGYYMMRTYEGQEVNQRMWLCQVIEFVFAEIPEIIFVRREMSNL